MVERLKNNLRTIFGVRKKRVPLPRSPLPALGARIVFDDFRMVVQAGLRPDLWAWLTAKGWREVTFRPDRRIYRDVPSSWVTELIDAPVEEREQALQAALANARRPQPATRRGFS
jgi:hypothetical protein